MKLISIMMMNFFAGVFMDIAYDIRQKKYDKAVTDEMDTEEDLCFFCICVRISSGELLPKSAAKLGQVPSIPVCAGQVK